MIQLFRHYWLPVFMSFALLFLPQVPLAADNTSIRIRMATTTSTENSGLLDYLLPHFEKQSGFTVDVIAVGTGKAIKLAERGDVDIILVHAPAAEMAFVEAGWIFHSEVVIWKDPVTAMQRTKALGLLYKQLRKDSAMSRQGIPDYLVTMRKPGENPKPVTKTHEGFPVARW